MNARIRQSLQAPPQERPERQSAPDDRARAACRRFFEPSATWHPSVSPLDIPSASSKEDSFVSEVSHHASGNIGLAPSSSSFWLDTAKKLGVL